MAKYLVIVESPAKAKTITKYLGKNYKVVASMGHLRDLPKSQLGVDIENDFEPKYITIRGKGELLSKLKRDAKNADKVYLATDPDREGEAISWHLANLLQIDQDSECRISFNEITKNAVKAAVKQPCKINEDLVNAQQARRVLDRVVGYQISPLFWKKVKKGLSAGRVQSVATRLVVDREAEIEQFIPEEYWSLIADLKKGKTSFPARFYGDKKGKIELENKQQVEEVLQGLEGAEYVVSSIKKAKKTKSPVPPFITSSLQQEASKKYGYTAKKTMSAAQQLYEGVEVEGIGLVGLITYMRTDSLRISEEAQAEARAYIQNQYGDDYLPKKPRVYKSKNNAQDAHEAIRPSMVSITPDQLKKTLPADQYKLYKLIWERFVASQMEAAVYDTISAEITANDYIFRANGSKQRFAGFMVLYQEAVDPSKRDEDEQDKDVKLPELVEGDVLTKETLNSKQHFTLPPQRYSEAALLKALEENGIGRPSTYAPTISTILQRGYVVREGKVLKPTELGIVVTDLMKQYFKSIVDVKFTANMESQLDQVEEGSTDWVRILKDFYGPFEQDLTSAEKEMEKVTIADEESDVICDKCGRTMVYKMGRFGKFLACPGFPECRNTKTIVVDTGALCPKCGGRVLEKKSQKGKKYFGCESNPTCDFVTWDQPTKEHCPKCGGSLFDKKIGKKKKQYCGKCDFERGGE
ncbi:MAG: type I DNA topoisomerase [Ruminococcaceae bacterium]|nr:type I DNA topoisomerase [Oscillospiraceae bacterium]